MLCPPSAGDKRGAGSLSEEWFLLADPTLKRRQQRELDENWQATSGLPLLLLMEQAAGAVSDFLRAQPPFCSQSRVTVFCGSGQNGGDGWAVARQIMPEARVLVVDLSQGRSLPEEAEKNRRAYKNLGGIVLSLEEAEGLDAPDFALDAMLGTGFRSDRAMPSDMARASQLMSRWRGSRCRIVSIDLPSGVDADTAMADPHAVRADDSVSFAAVKAGIAGAPGAQYAGRIHSAAIGIPKSMLEQAASSPRLRQSNPELLRALRLSRPPDGHKGHFGRALLLAGSEQYPGALLLAAEAVLRSGVGYLHAVSQAAPCSDLLRAFPEILVQDEPCFLAEGGGDSLAAATAVAAGSGWGRAARKDMLLELLLDRAERLILDADALNLLAERRDWPQLCAARRRRFGDGSWLLTPHPAEFLRLCRGDARIFAQGRDEAARELAAESGAVVLLKGYRSVIAFPDGRALINPTGDDGLARAGSGDVLLGLILGLAAQGLTLDASAVAAAWLHGLCGEIGGKEKESRCLCSGELAKLLPEAFRRSGWSKHSQPD